MKACLCLLCGAVVGLREIGGGNPILEVSRQGRKDAALQSVGVEEDIRR